MDGDEEWDKAKYKNWVRGAKGLEYLQKGLQNFVGVNVQSHRDQTVLNLTNTLTSGSSVQCNQCTLQNLLPEHAGLNQCTRNTNTCIQHSSGNCFGNKPEGRRKCPNGICSKLYDEIVRAHRFKDPMWRNTDPGTWCSDPAGWSFAKCFQTTPNPGTCSSETDAAGLLSVILSDKLFQNEVSCNLAAKPNIFSSAREIRNDILHSPKMELEDSILQGYIDVFITVLQDPTVLLNDQGAVEVVQKLLQLKNDEITISLSEQVKLIQIKKDALNALEQLEEKEKKVVAEIEEREQDTLAKIEGAISEALEKINESDIKKRVQDAEDKIEQLTHTIQNLKRGYPDKPVDTVSDSSCNVPDKQNKPLSSAWEKYGRVETLFDTFNKRRQGEIRQWKECLLTNDTTIRTDAAKSLLNSNTLPDQSQLEMACAVFGRVSDTFLTICEAVSKYIKTRSHEIIDVWPAYRYSEFKAYGKIKTVFVVFTEEGNVDVSVDDYNIYERGKCVFSKESEQVLTEVELAQKDKDQFNESDLLELEKCVSENADILMNNHKNLGIISPSVKKSKGFGKENSNIRDLLCIALYVHIKDLIPIAEEPFPVLIENFPTDILEGSFIPYHGGPYAYHEQLKMGLAIHANATNNQGNRIVGTLGGFLDHPLFGVCGLTCAHVVLSEDEMIHLKHNQTIDFHATDKMVFQPVDQTATPFGRVKSAIYSEGGIGSSGMEIALIEIFDRLPSSGCFPSSDNYEDAGFDDDNPMVYNTGRVCELSNIPRRAEVYKYGISTEVTRGSLGYRGSVIRTTGMLGQCQSFGYFLRNQIEILRIDGKSFALPGDSGTLVFFDDHSGDSVAIGIVEGGQNNGKVFVTPICDILNKMECPPTMKNFLTSSLDAMDYEDSEYNYSM